MERSVYNLLAMRDLLMRRCKEFKIPTEWMFDSGIISKVYIHTYIISILIYVFVFFNDLSDYNFSFNR